MIEDSESSLSSEDETGNLINAKNSKTFFSTLQKLRAKDASIYDAKSIFFQGK